jgi:hypothetical protein
MKITSMSGLLMKMRKKQTMLKLVSYKIKNIKIPSYKFFSRII